MRKRIAPLAVGFGREDGEVMRELAARGWGGNMERLLIKNNGYRVSKLTRHPAKKCSCIPLDRKLVSVKFSGFALALPTFSLGFCGGQPVNSPSLMVCDSYLEVLLLLLLSLSAGTHDRCCRLKLKESYCGGFFFGWLSHVIPITASGSALPKWEVWQHPANQYVLISQSSFKEATW